MLFEIPFELAASCGTLCEIQIQDTAKLADGSASQTEAMHADLVNQATIGSWEGAISEHSRMNLAPLRAPLRDPSKIDGLPSLCCAIDAIEGHTRADVDALGIAATRTLMAASSMAAASSRQYLGHGAGQWTQPASSSGAHADPTGGEDDDGGTEGTDDDDEHDAERRAQSRSVRQRVKTPAAPAYQMQGVPPQQQFAPSASAHSNGHAGIQYPPHHAVSYAQHGAGGQAQPLAPGVQPGGGHAGGPMVVLPNGVLIPAELCAIARGNGPAGMAGLPQQIGHAVSAAQAGHGQHGQVTPAPRPQKPTESTLSNPSTRPPVTLPRQPSPSLALPRPPSPSLALPRRRPTRRCSLQPWP